MFYMKRKIFSLIIVFSTIIFVLTSNVKTVSAADVFKGRYDTGNITYSIINGSNGSFASTAIKQWTGVSSKVKFNKYNGKYATNAKLLLNFNKIKSPTAGLLGVTILRDKFLKSVTPNGTWVSALCIQYINPNAKSNTQKIKTCVHEIGHALSLAHPSSVKTQSIMRQGIMNRYTLFASDKNNLRAKWGR